MVDLMAKSTLKRRKMLNLEVSLKKWRSRWNLTSSTTLLEYRPCSTFTSIVHTRFHLMSHTSLPSIIRHRTRSSTTRSFSPTGGAPETGAHCPRLPSTDITYSDWHSRVMSLCSTPIEEGACKHDLWRAGQQLRARL